MTPNEFSLSVGEDYASTLSMTPAKDITGWTVEFRATGMKGQNTIVKDNATRGGVTITTPTTGVLTLNLSRADTVGTVPDVYQWSVRRIDSGYNTVLGTGTMYTTPTLVGG